LWALPYIFPFVAAVLFAALIDTPVNYLETRYSVPRGWAVGSVLFLVVCCSLAFISLLVVNLVWEISSFSSVLPSLIGTGQKIIINLTEHLQTYLYYLPDPISKGIVNSLEQLGQLVSYIATAILIKLQSLPNMFFTATITVVATFFMSRDKRIMAQVLLKLLPVRWHEAMFKMKRMMVTGLVGLLKSQLILFLITFIIAMGNFLLFKVPYAWMLGLLAAFFDIMPIVGPGGVYVPLILYRSFIGEWKSAIALICSFGALVLVRQILEPKVIGKQVGLHPLSMLISLYLGVKILGVNGLWLGPFLAIVGKALYTLQEG
jgi:sporulation integral membrane protein YtvI